MKKLLFLVIIYLLSGCEQSSEEDFLLSSGIQQKVPDSYSTPEPSKGLEHKEDNNVEPEKEKEIDINDLVLPSGAFFPNDNLAMTFKIANPTKQVSEIWIEWQLLNYQKEVVYTVTKSWIVPWESTLLRELAFVVPDNLMSGSYYSKILIYDRKAGSDSSILVTELIAEEQITIYRKQEDFDELNRTDWNVSDKRLGRSKLSEQNISVQEGKLIITMPAGSVDGGEISTQEPVGYGTYEVRMKLPQIPSSITGFFLYEPPDYQHEIDIELYNSKDGSIMFTTYFGGEVTNHESLELGFDPTADYHDYRFEYKKDYVAFYVDNVKRKDWSEGIPQEEMRLMINAWYPNWLEGKPSANEQTLTVDWIRY